MAEAFYRSDAQAKVAGRAVYGVDLEVPRMLVGRVVRSTVPRGRITRLDVSRAAAIPGSPSSPLPTFPSPVRHGRQGPAAARERRRPVQRRAARGGRRAGRGDLGRAVAAVVVDIEPEPGVFDLETAAASPTPPRPPGPGGLRGELRGPSAAATLRSDGEITSGDVDAAFAGQRSSSRASTRRRASTRATSSPASCLATVDQPGGFSRDDEHAKPVRRARHPVLGAGLPESQVRVVGSTVGGGFGGKLDVTLRALRLPARAQVRPAGEDCEFARRGARRGQPARELGGPHPQRGRRRRPDRRHARSSACSTPGPTPTTRPSSGRSPPCRPPARTGSRTCARTALSVYTNTQPTGAYRGRRAHRWSSRSRPTWRRSPRRLGERGIDLRRRHFFRDGDVALNGQVIQRPTVEDCLDRARTPSTTTRRAAAGRGVGIACAWWTTTAGAAAATAKLENDGTVAVITGGTEIGSGALTAGVVSLTARALGVTESQVRLASTGDTGTGAYDFGAQGSRTTFNVGNAVLGACDDIARSDPRGGRAPPGGRSQATSSSTGRVRCGASPASPSRSATWPPPPPGGAARSTPRRGTSPRRPPTTCPASARSTSTRRSTRRASTAMRSRSRSIRTPVSPRPEVRRRPGRREGAGAPGDRGPDPGRSAAGDRDGAVRGGGPSRRHRARTRAWTATRSPRSWKPPTSGACSSRSRRTTAHRVRGRRGATDHPARRRTRERGGRGHRPRDHPAAHDSAEGAPAPHGSTMTSRFDRDTY